MQRMSLVRVVFAGTLFFCGMVSNVIASDEPQNKWVWVTEQEDQIGLKKYNVNSPTFNIPSSYAGAKVVEICSEAFKGCEAIEKVSLPEGIILIADSAFEGCKNLREINMPRSLKTIGRNAFRGCENLQVMSFPDGLLTIDDCAFEDCSALDSVHVPKTVTKIGYCPFGHRTRATIDPHNENYTIADGVLFNKSKKCLIWCPDYKFDPPIGPVVPSSTNNLGLFEIPDGVKDIGAFAFNFSRGLKKLVIPESVKKIDKYAFSGCRQLQSVVLPNIDCDWTEIFRDSRESITEMHFAEGTKELRIGYRGNYSDYQRCEFPNLRSVNIPSSIDSLDAGIFKGCNGFNKGVVIVDDCVLFVNGWCPSDVVLPEGTRMIAKGAFYEENQLHSVEIPGSVKEIPRWTFSGCKNLTKVIIHEGVEEIGENAFSSCSSLVSVKLPKSLKRVVRDAFGNCENLREATFGNTATLIGDDVFSYTKVYRTRQIRFAIFAGVAIFSIIALIVLLRRIRNTTLVQQGRFIWRKMYLVAMPLLIVSEAIAFAGFDWYRATVTYDVSILSNIGRDAIIGFLLIISSLSYFSSKGMTRNLTRLFWVWIALSATFIFLNGPYFNENLGYAYLGISCQSIPEEYIYSAARLSNWLMILCLLSIPVGLLKYGRILVYLRNVLALIQMADWTIWSWISLHQDKIELYFQVKERIYYFWIVPCLFLAFVAILFFSMIRRQSTEWPKDRMWTEGRIGRLSYLWRCFTVFYPFNVLQICVEPCNEWSALLDGRMAQMMVFSYVLTFAATVSTLGIMSRRLHDTGRSCALALWQIGFASLPVLWVILGPDVGPLFFLLHIVCWIPSICVSCILLFFRGENGSNKYGANA